MRTLFINDDLIQFLFLLIEQSSWYNNKQDQQQDQQQDNSFSNTSPHILQEQQAGDFGTGWNQLNNRKYYG